jgi:hypothetical protein
MRRLREVSFSIFHLSLAIEKRESGAATEIGRQGRSALQSAMIGLWRGLLQSYQLLVAAPERVLGYQPMKNERWKMRNGK